MYSAYIYYMHNLLSKWRWVCYPKASLTETRGILTLTHTHQIRWRHYRHSIYNEVMIGYFLKPNPTPKPVDISRLHLKQNGICAHCKLWRALSPCFTLFVRLYKIVIAKPVHTRARARGRCQGEWWGRCSRWRGVRRLWPDSTTCGTALVRYNVRLAVQGTFKFSKEINNRSSVRWTEQKREENVPCLKKHQLWAAVIKVRRVAAATYSYR